MLLFTRVLLTSVQALACLDAQAGALSRRAQLLTQVVKPPYFFRLSRKVAINLVSRLENYDTFKLIPYKFKVLDSETVKTMIDCALYQ